MKKYQGYLIDLDGTMYRGQEPIEWANTFIHTLQKRNIPYLFVTNNASLTRQTIADKLNELDIPCNIHNVFTSAIATAKYIKETDQAARCYVVGEDALFTACKNEHLQIVKEDANYVVMGLDREITYEKLSTACLEIRKGAKFISTNPDKAIPREDGLYPGNGALTAAVEASTGVQPLYIGKPEKIIMEQAIQLLGVQKDQVLMIGDNYETDISAGINAGLDTLMVLTGVTAETDVDKLPVKPTYVMKDLGNYIQFI